MLGPIRLSLLMPLVLAAVAALNPAPVRADEFTFDLKAEADMARRLSCQA